MTYADLRLYSVTVTGVCPWQCVTVFDNEERAIKLAKHLNKTVANECRVFPVDSFFPSGMVDADSMWIDEATKYSAINGRESI